jgi:hypothetical protein
MVHVLHCGITFNAFNADTDHTLFLRWIKQHTIKPLHCVLKQTYRAEFLGKLKNFKSVCLLDDEHPVAAQNLVLIFPSRKNTEIITMTVQLELIEILQTLLCPRRGVDDYPPLSGIRGYLLAEQGGDTDLKGFTTATSQNNNQNSYKNKYITDTTINMHTPYYHIHSLYLCNRMKLLQFSSY